jgi:hypothetical protein
LDLLNGALAKSYLNRFLGKTGGGDKGVGVDCQVLKNVYRKFTTKYSAEIPKG